MLKAQVDALLGTLTDPNEDIRSISTANGTLILVKGTNTLDFDSASERLVVTPINPENNNSIIHTDYDHIEMIIVFAAPPVVVNLRE